MDIQRLAYIALKEVLTTNRQEGDILMPLKNKGYNLTDTQVREVADFIETNNLGKKTPISRGRIIIRANSNAADFVKQQEHLPFEQRLRLIYSELLSRPERKGDLETILITLVLDHSTHDISNYAKHCNTTGQAICFDTKTDCEITLTQLGIDYLYQDQPPKIEPIVQNVKIEQYQHSIVNKGDNITQSGVFESGIKRDNNSAINNPITNPTPIPNPNSPTKRIQKWQFAVAVIGVLTVVALALLKKFGIL